MMLQDEAPEDKMLKGKIPEDMKLNHKKVPGRFPALFPGYFPALFMMLMACVLLLAVCTSVLSVRAAAPTEFLFDDAGLFTESEREALVKKLDALRKDKELDAVIVTTNSTEGKTARAYADDFLDDGGYGYGDENSAILFLIDMGGRELYISTQGAAIEYFTDARIELMLDHVYNRAAAGDYYKAANVFTDDARMYMNLAPGRELLTVSRVLIMLFISCLVGGAAALIAGLVVSKGARVRVHGGDYLVDASVQLVGERDILVNSITTSRRIETHTDSSSGGDGGSSTHVSSGGVTHGGGGRKF